MNPILIAVVLLALIPAIHFMRRSPRKTAIKRCIAITKRLKGTSNFGSPGDESALDEYHELVELTDKFGITDEEIHIQNKTVVAQQALASFMNFAVANRKAKNDLHFQMAQEFSDEFLGEGLTLLVPHGGYATAAH